MRDALGLNVRAAAGPSESYDAEAMTFEFVLATSKPCRSYRYLVTDTDSYPRWTEVEEQLVIAGAEGLDGDDGLVGSSILNSHSYWDVEAIVGVIESARLADEGLVCTGRLSRRDGVADIATDIEDGIIRSVSVGFDILEETASLRDGQVPLVTISRWRPREASLVAVPADSAARIRSGAPDVSQPKTTPAPLKATRSAEPAPASTETPPVAVEAQAAVVEPEAEAIVQAEVDGLRSALAAAEAKLTTRAAPPAAKPAPAPAADAVRAAHVQILRGIASKKGPAVLEEFEGIAATGGTVDELRTVCVAAIHTGGGEIAGVSIPSGGARAAETTLKTRSEYRDERAAARR
ncbi:hypothetical protein ASF49_08130 [Methylobacterium sp. Leaf104]|uniref:HK97 family phage prohead protease n=1 Tax=Methylobacterium TaxID=407 RepID=UPI0007012091|nr:MULTISPECIES: HK97 family phage prohead protease [Methylobacterium]KQP33825.1 hypothetical protein ASF49_08130 [Methylobacterium sp. Leaf104]MCI9879607.1 HK97 family phage prohead protease [Methylobacterium goesingense]